MIIIHHFHPADIFEEVASHPLVTKGTFQSHQKTRKDRWQYHLLSGRVNSSSKLYTCSSKALLISEVLKPNELSQ